MFSSRVLCIVPTVALLSTLVTVQGCVMCYYSSCPEGYYFNGYSNANTYGSCAGTKVQGYCILPPDDAERVCNSDAACGGISKTTNAGWLAAYPGMLQLGKMPITANRDWWSCIKAPKLAAGARVRERNGQHLEGTVTDTDYKYPGVEHGIVITWDDTWRRVAVQAGYWAQHYELIGYSYKQVNANGGTRAVCNDDFQIPAWCGNCGPSWGDLNKCKELCDNEVTCNYLTFFSDNGCRIYTACDSTWNQGYGDGNVESWIHQKQLSGGGRRLSAADAGRTVLI